MTRKITALEHAASALSDMRTCLSLLDLAFSLAESQEVRDAISKAVKAAEEKSRQQQEALKVARHGVHNVTTEYVDGFPVEVPRGSHIKAVGKHTLICDSEDKKIASVYEEGEGFVIRVGLNVMPELHSTRAAALNFFFTHYHAGIKIIK